MKQLFLLFCFVSIVAQESEVYSVFFETDKYVIDDSKGNELLKFIQESDSTQIESINIYGYCDDRGKESYNLTLSQNRADAVKQLLIDNGIKNKIIVNIEGKGKILLEDDVKGNVAEMRSKNRRVDVVLERKPVEVQKLRIPGMYSSIQKEHVIGDRIYLENVFFETGSSQLTAKTTKELNRVALLMQRYPYLHFEIQGHICCTPQRVKEAVDKDTKKRELSVNRAKKVYNYLIRRTVKKERLSYVGLGNTQPLGKEKWMDRRVELVITKIDEH